jgi:pimeloyl-ACP methyl ester carboxylesterase
MANVSPSAQTKVQVPEQDATRVRYRTARVGDLFYDCRTNVPLYPEFQAFFRKYQPPTLIVWGKNDVIFPPEGAAPYRRDLPDVETHLLDTGHFALERHGEEIADPIASFLAGPKVRRERAS